MNNRTQKVNTLLDSLTKTEIENYLKDRKINIKTIEMLRGLSKIREETHFNKIVNSINKESNLNDMVSNYIHLGEARILGFILSEFYNKKYDESEIKKGMKEYINRDKKLKEYTHDCMKDF